jgi:hypothetical protein
MQTVFIRLNNTAFFLSTIFSGTVKNIFHFEVLLNIGNSKEGCNHMMMNVLDVDGYGN